MIFSLQLFSITVGVCSSDSGAIAARISSEIFFGEMKIFSTAMLAMHVLHTIYVAPFLHMQNRVHDSLVVLQCVSFESVARGLTDNIR